MGNFFDEEFTVGRWRCPNETKSIFNFFAKQQVEEGKEKKIVFNDDAFVMVDFVLSQIIEIELPENKSLACVTLLDIIIRFRMNRMRFYSFLK